MMLKLVVFLGNPGSQYAQTRHNAAWLCCDTYVTESKWQEKFHGLFLKKGETVFLKPQTYMNESGISVQETAKFFNIKADNILIVHDDIEMKFGDVKIQLGGGLGGHNGLRSVKQHMNTDVFWRLKIGVGRPEVMDVASWVTSRFTVKEESELSRVFSHAYDIIDSWLKEQK